jgi:hypothetical protein
MTTERRTIDITGYDIVATANCDHGAVLVLNNNSSHYLVAESDAAGEGFAADGMHTVQRHPRATLVASFAYGPRDSRAAYLLALADMVARAAEHTSDGDAFDPEACPTCGSKPGEGRGYVTRRIGSPGRPAQRVPCSDPDGCGYYYDESERVNGGDPACPRT